MLLLGTYTLSHLTHPCNCFYWGNASFMRYFMENEFERGNLCTSRLFSFPSACTMRAAAFPFLWPLAPVQRAAWGASAAHWSLRSSSTVGHVRCVGASTLQHAPWKYWGCGAKHHTSSCACPSGMLCFLRTRKQSFNQQHAIIEALYLLKPDAAMSLGLGLPYGLSLQ